MSIFTILVIAFIIVPIIRNVIKHYNEQNTQEPSVSKWESSYSPRLRSILTTCSGFQDEEIIDSAVGFYLFSYNDTTEEFIFIQEEGVAVIHRIPYSSLVSFHVRDAKDYRIFIDLKTSLPNKSYISVECFNKEKVLQKMPYLQSAPQELDSLYRVEFEKVEEIEFLLQEILEGYKEDDLGVPPPPPFEAGRDEEPQEISEEEPTPIVLPEELPVVEEDKSLEEIPVYSEEPEEVKEYKTRPVLDIWHTEDVPPMVDEVKKEEPLLDEVIDSNTIPSAEGDYASMDESRTDVPGVNLPIVQEVVIEDGKVQVSLSDVDTYSRGKFLESEVQSAVGDAKVKGQKYIYLTPEQLDKLKS